MTNFDGVAAWLGYIFALVNEVWKHLFSNMAGFEWTRSAGDSLAGSNGQWVFSGNLPVLSQKGEDIIAAIMTMVHNGIIFVAEITTLLPYNATT